MHKLPRVYSFIVFMYKLVGSLVIASILLVTTYFFKNPSIPQKSQAAVIDNTINKKVLVLNFNPFINGTTELTTYKGWNNPITLQNQYVSDVTSASHGVANYQIVQTQTIRDYPFKANGFKFTQQQYLDCVNTNGASSPNCPTGIDYNRLITDYNLCGQVNSGTIDEVWLWGGPWFGYWEATMAGPNAFYTNSNPITNTTCSIDLHIMGFSYERTNVEMIHNLGHRTEGTMKRVYGSWDVNLLTAWNRYSIYNLELAGKSGCGNVHFPPNGTGNGYDYANSTNVSSYCNDWLNYPSTTGIKTSLNCTPWSCSGNGVGGTSNFFEKWWLSHLPYKTGTTNNKLNNWWKYVMDYSNAILPVTYGEKWYTVDGGGANDYNTSCSSTQNGVNEVYIGTNSGCTTNNSYTAVINFQNVQIPQGAIINDSYLEFIVDGPYTNTLNETITLSNGAFTTSPIPWNIANSWSTQTKVQSPAIKAALQQLVNSTTWSTGGTVTVKINHVSGTGARRFFAFEREPMASARLVLNSQASNPITPTITPMPTVTPNPTATLTPTPIATIQRIYTISSGLNDWNLLCDNSVDSTKPTLIIGQNTNCTTQPAHFVDLDYFNIQIPRYAVITDAYVEVVSAGNYSNNFTNNGYVYANSNGVYSYSTSDWVINNNWSTNSTIRSGSLVSAVQNAVNAPTWNSGAEMLVRFSYKIGSGNGTRSFYSYNFDPAKAPKLVISYRNPTTTPTPTVTPTPNQASSCFNFRDQNGNNYRDNVLFTLNKNSTYLMTPTFVGTQSAGVPTGTVISGSTTYFQMYDSLNILQNLTFKNHYPGSFTIKTGNNPINNTYFIISDRPNYCKSYVNFKIQ